MVYTTYVVFSDHRYFVVLAEPTLGSTGKRRAYANFLDLGSMGRVSPHTPFSKAQILDFDVWNLHFAEKGCGHPNEFLVWWVV